jgi:opacity protein-like surface antigen
MKRILLSAFLGVITLSIAAAQGQDKSKRPSPAVSVTGTIDGVQVKIDYSAPSAKGRKMLGGNEPYGKVWRTGANEATVFEIDKPVVVEGKALAAGKYELFTVPGESEWTIIFQKHKGQWGAYSYQESSDALRVNVKAGKTPAFVETFVIEVDKNQVILKWENTLVAFGIKKG